MTTTLRELLAERHELDALVEEQGGEVPADLEAAWAANNEAVPHKIESWGLWVKRQEHLEDAIAAEIDRLKERKGMVRNAIERSKAELQRQMAMAGIDKVKGVLVTVAVAKNPPSVKGELDAETLENLYHSGPAIVKHVPESFVLDRKAALDAHKAGASLPAGLSVEQSTGIRIR